MDDADQLLTIRNSEEDEYRDCGGPACSGCDGQPRLGFALACGCLFIFLLIVLVTVL